MTERNKLFYAVDDLSVCVKKELELNMERRNEYGTNSIIRPENISQCSRRISYRINGFKFDKDAILSSGNLDKKDIWITRIGLLDNVSVKGINVEAGDIFHGISGIADMVIRFENKLIDAVVLIYPTNNLVDISKGNPPKKDIMSMLLYMWLLEIKNGLILYYQIDKEDFELIHVIPYNPLINSMKEKLIDKKKKKMMGVLPERAYKEKSAIECTKCEFFNTCWKKE